MQLGGVGKIAILDDYLTVGSITAGRYVQETNATVDCTDRSVSVSLVYHNQHGRL